MLGLAPNEMDHIVILKTEWDREAATKLMMRKSDELHVVSFQNSFLILQPKKTAVTIAKEAVVVF